MHLELVTLNTSNKQRKFKKNFKKKQMQDMQLANEREMAEIEMRNRQMAEIQRQLEEAASVSTTTTATALITEDLDDIAR